MSGYYFDSYIQLHICTAWKTSGCGIELCENGNTSFMETYRINCM